MLPLFSVFAWAALLSATLRAAADGCSGNSSYSPGLHEFLHLHPDGQDGPSRRFTLYVPQAAVKGEPLPVVLLTPGNENDPHQFLKFPDILSLAEEAPFLLAELIGEHNQFNVELNSLASPERQDDVAYTQAVLDHVQEQSCMDRRRVYCVGMSRGARFCVRLASELSEEIAALGIVSGLRYPQPNNATRPMPVIAFHGTADTIDPYEGGGFDYWGTATVPEELARWGVFNGCQGRDEPQPLPGAEGVRREAFTNCSNGADAVLYTLKDAPHSWPGTAQLYGPKTQLLNVTSVMWDFLSKHHWSRPATRAWGGRLFAKMPHVHVQPPHSRWGSWAGLAAMLGFLGCKLIRWPCSGSAQSRLERDLDPLL